MNMNQETVLIIEDDAELRGILAIAIKRAGAYSIIEAADGPTGLERALTVRPDVIILDLALPYLGGLEIMRLLREQHCELPIIVTTADGSPQTILRAFRLGAKDYLRKPFKVGDVRSALEHALIEERLRQEKQQLAESLQLSNRRMQRQLDNWVALNDIAQAITSAQQETEIYKRVMDNVSRILQVEAASLLLLDQETQELEFKVTSQSDMTDLADIRLKMGEGIAGWVALHGEPLLVPNVAEDPRFCSMVDHKSGFQTRSILCVPLKVQENVIGVIEVINKQGQSRPLPFNLDDLDLLSTLASWVTVAVENVHLNAQAQDLIAARTMKQTVVTLAHHINNELMVFSLEIDSLERRGFLEQPEVKQTYVTARECIHEIASVIRALNELVEVNAVTYVGGDEMIDITEPLQNSRSLK